mmetsp:Transcript_11544/g.17479  ORF Transcript_11544/g.17479 Transcript_11544/m.17479 type:complete len:133 (+) Transcript_11544:98-496(+)
MKVLFYMNAMFEFGTSLFAMMKPSTLSDGHQLNKSGKIYARRMGYLLGAFSISSLLIATQPDTPAKHMYALSWSCFHFGVVIDRIFLQNEMHKKLINSTIHALFSIAFAYYTYKGNIPMHMSWKQKHIAILQ